MRGKWIVALWTVVSVLFFAPIALMADEPVSAQSSYFTLVDIEDEGTVISRDVNANAMAMFSLFDRTARPVSTEVKAPLVYVWASEENSPNPATDAFVIESADKASLAPEAKQLYGATALKNVENGAMVHFHFIREGVYKIHAGVAPTDSVNSVEELIAFKSGETTDIQTGDKEDKPDVDTSLRDKPLYKKIVLQAYHPYLNLDGHSRLMSSGPILRDGRMYIPLRALTQVLNCRIEWDDDSYAVLIYYRGKTFKLPIGEKYFEVQGSQGKMIHTMDAATFIGNNRTYLPVRAISEQFGYQIEWEAQTRSAILHG